MPYQPPVRDHLFLLRDVLEIEKYANLPGFAEGWISVQDEAAQLAADLLDLAPGQRVLDACCAPGPWHTV